MTYKVVVKNKSEKRTELIDGIKALHLNLTLFRSQGWEIKKIQRVL